MRVLRLGSNASKFKAPPHEKSKVKKSILKKSKVKTWKAGRRSRGICPALCMPPPRHHPLPVRVRVGGWVCGCVGVGGCVGVCGCHVYRYIYTYMWETTQPVE
jgi:hypothetical protein